MKHGVEERQGRRPSPVDRILHSRYYPALPHLVLYIFLAVLILFAFAPAQRGEGNLATELVWKLWWPLLPFLLLLGGRIWCGVCPFGGLADLAGRMRGSRRPVPRFVRRYGPWGGILSVFLFGLAFLALGLESNATATGWVLIGMGIAATGFALLFRGRGFCRYLCPVGFITRLYSFLSWLQPAGAGEAQRGVRCPVSLSPASLPQPSQCHLCGACSRHQTGGIKADFGIGGPRRPGLSEFGRPEAAMSIILLALMAADSVRMTSLFARYQEAALPLFGFNYRLAVLGGVLSVTVTILAFHLLAAAFSARDSAFWQSFGRIGFASLPLTMGIFLALAMQHLWSGGWPALQTMLVEFRLIDWTGHMPPTNVYFFSVPLKLIQFSLVAVGVCLSLGEAGRLRDPGASASGRQTAIGSSLTAPGRLIAMGGGALPAAGFGLLFLLPMSGAC